MARAGGGGGGGGGITNAVNVGIAVQADWENREFISHISLNIRRLFDFLIQFESTTKSKLSSLNLKLDTLERRLQLLELQVSTATSNPSLFTSTTTTTAWSLFFFFPLGFSYCNNQLLIFFWGVIYQFLVCLLFIFFDISLGLIPLKILLRYW